MAFTYGSDLWIADRSGGPARRLTSTAAVESDPHFSPDGKQIAFSSNRSGTDAVYVVGVEGGAPTRLIWYPGNDLAGTSTVLTDALADAVSPAWDRDGRHLYFLASTDLALGSGWANTSSIASNPNYGAYVMVLRGDDPTPFPPRATRKPLPRRPNPTRRRCGSGSTPRTWAAGSWRWRSRSGTTAWRWPVPRARYSSVSGPRTSPNDRPAMAGSWTETVEPIRDESELRQRAWVEDNRRRVDELSGGKLAYVWVPNTGGGGYRSFNRYLFAQQDKVGAVIDERFNGGGNLDDYMVDYLNRTLRGAITNEVPGGAPFLIPQGVLGPKVLLINELAGSGGDYFPWAFRQQKVGPLIGARTWGGLVKSSVHYALIDGGALTAPDNAVFDPINNRWVAEHEGVPPDIEVLIDAKSIAAGRDPQLERAVQETMRLVSAQPSRKVVPPPFPRPSKRPGRP